MSPYTDDANTSNSRGVHCLSLDFNIGIDSFIFTEMKTLRMKWKIFKKG